MGEIHPRAESFLLTGHEPTACLFIHGLTASPSEVYPVAYRVHEESGHTVSGPLLPGHGCSPAEMNQTGWEDWWGRVAEEITYLQRRHTRIYIAGLSMGGLLALLAARRVAPLEGVITINAPILTNSPGLLALAPLIQYIRPFYPKEMDESAQEMEVRGRFAYPVWPVKALLAMQRLRKRVIQELPELELPILAFQSRLDKAVDPRSATLLKEKARAAPVKIIELASSGHIATMGPQQALIVAEIVKFMSLRSE